jgi:hypothetical protein
MIMRVVFVSNYFIHQQEPFSLAMQKELCGDFCFVATTPFPQERLAIGYSDMNKKYPWIIRAYESDEAKALAKQMILDADLVIYGSGREEFITQRIKDGKLVFRYSERIYKNGVQFWKLPIRIIRHRKMFQGYKNQIMAKRGL